MRIVACGLIGLASFLMAGQTYAFDCAKASTPTEKAICGNIALKATDDQMAENYTALVAKLGAAERKTLQNAQRGWLNKRNECTASNEMPLSCLLERTSERVTLLSGKIPARALKNTQSPAIEPVVVFQQGDARHYAIDDNYVRFSNPKTAGEKAFNAAINALIADSPTDEIPKDEEMFGQYASETTARISFLSDAIIASEVQFYAYEGGAHGNYGTWSLAFDLKTGAELSYLALFDGPARSALFDLCREQIIASKQEKLQQYDYKLSEDGNYSDEYLRASLEDFGQWILEPNHARVVFNPYTVGSYAEGEFECKFDAQTLAHLSNGRLDL